MTISLCAAPICPLSIQTQSWPQERSEIHGGGCGLCLCLAEDGEEREQRQDQESHV
jgi:hypothetical protein